MQEKLEAIKAVVVAANPSILDLGFGCEVMSELGKDKYIILGKVRSAKSTLFITYNPQRESIGESPVMAHKILGRPIRLADILLAMNKKNEWGVAFSENNQFVVMSAYDSNVSKCKYNLLQDDLTLQSKECIDLLFDLLTTK